MNETSETIGWGFVPHPSALTTVEGCSHTIRRIASSKALVQAKPGRDARHKRAIVKEVERLNLLTEEVKAIRTRLGSDDRLRWERMFVWCAHEELDQATYERIGQMARDRVESQRRVSASASVGAALMPRGGGGGVRERA